MGKIDFSIIFSSIAMVVSIISIIIAHKRLKIEEIGLNLELYEKRKSIYKEIEKLFGIILRDGDISKDEIFEFYRNTENAYFLFDENIDSYINEIYEKAFDLHYLAKKTDIRDLDKYKEVFSWFKTEMENLKKKFERYLKIEKV